MSASSDESTVFVKNISGADIDPYAPMKVVRLTDGIYEVGKTDLDDATHVFINGAHRIINNSIAEVPNHYPAAVLVKNTGDGFPDTEDQAGTDAANPGFLVKDKSGFIVLDHRQVTTADGEEIDVAYVLPAAGGGDPLQVYKAITGVVSGEVDVQAVDIDGNPTGPVITVKALPAVL